MLYIFLGFLNTRLKLFFFYIRIHSMDSRVNTVHGLDFYSAFVGQRWIGKGKHKND